MASNNISKVDLEKEKTNNIEEWDTLYDESGQECSKFLEKVSLIYFDQ